MKNRVFTGLAIVGAASSILSAVVVFAQTPSPAIPPTPVRSMGVGPMDFPPAPPPFGPAPFGPALFEPPPFGPPQGVGPFPPAGAPRETARDLCLDDVAREAGARGYWSAKLDLTQAQQPLWQRVDAAASVGEAAKRKLCAKLPPTPDAPQPTPPQALAHRQELLEAELAELQQLQPTIAALYDSLSPEQRAVIDPPSTLRP